MVHNVKELNILDKRILFIMVPIDIKQLYKAYQAIWKTIIYQLRTSELENSFTDCFHVKAAILLVMIRSVSVF